MIKGIIDAIVNFFTAVGEASRLRLELKKVKEKNSLLEEENKRLEEQLKGPDLPKDYPVYEITWTDLVKELEELGLELMLKEKYPPDRIVSYTDRESWEKMVPFLTYPAEEYVSQACDCDNYAKKASADAAFLFKLEGCLQCWGNIPGYHAFNMVYTGKKTYALFEPNAGFVWAGKLFKPGDNEYQPKSWK